MSGLTEHAEMELRAEIERLRTERAGDQHRMFHYECIIDEQAKKITEVVAFLDGLANRLDENYADRNYQFRSPQQAAADCRTMAKRLRGET